MEIWGLTTSGECASVRERRYSGDRSALGVRGPDTIR